MNIIILRLNVGNFGKIGTYNVQEVGLAKILIKLGHNVKVIYLNRETDKVIQDETYNYVYYFPHISIGIHGIFNLSLLESFNPEKLILFSDNQFWAKNVIKWCAMRDIKCIHYFGNVLSDNKFWLNQLYTKLILLRNKHSYKISINVAKTRKAQQEMEYYNIQCSKIINIGLDMSLLNDCVNPNYYFRKQFGFMDNEKVLLFVGRIVDYKKPFLACEVLQELINRGLSYRLIVIGKGPLELEFKKYIIDMKLSDKIMYMEKVDYNEIYKYMVACDCFINLSSIEIFGMAILEAMYFGLPVVAHVAPGPNEIIIDSMNGILINSDSPKEISNCVISAIENKQKLSFESRKSVLEKYIWEKTGLEFLKL